MGLAATVVAGIVLLRRPGRVALLCVMLLVGVYEVTDRQVFGFLAVAAAGAFIPSRRPHWLFLAGLCTGLAGLYSLEVGLGVGVAVLLWVVLDTVLCREGRARWTRAASRELLALLGGLLVALVPFVAWCAAHGIIGDLVGNIHAQLFMRKELYPSFYPGLDWRSSEPLLSNLRVVGGTVLIFYLIPVMILGGLLIGLAARPDSLQTRARASCS